MWRWAAHYCFCLLSLVSFFFLSRHIRSRYFPPSLSQCVFVCFVSLIKRNFVRSVFRMNETRMWIESAPCDEFDQQQHENNNNNNEEAQHLFKQWRWQKRQTCYKSNSNSLPLPLPTTCLPQSNNSIQHNNIINLICMYDTSKRKCMLKCLANVHLVDDCFIVGTIRCSLLMKQT